MATRKTTKKASAKSSPRRQSLAKKVSKTDLELHEESMNQTFSPMVHASPSRRRLYIGVVVVALVALLAFALKGYLIAAMVNGQPVSRLEVIGQLEKQGGKQILQSLVTRDLILQEAKKRNVTLSQADIDKDLASIEASYKAQGQTLDQVLKLYGVTKQEVIDQRKPFILLDKMVGADVKVTDKEVQDFIAKNNESYGGTLKADQVKQDLESQALKQKEQDFIDKLQKDAKIDYFVNY
jgi:foldase protein PrsA